MDDRSRGQHDVGGAEPEAASSEQRTIGAGPAAHDPVHEIKASAVWERAMKKMQRTPEWTESLGKLLQPQERGKVQYKLLEETLKDLVATREIRDRRQKVWIQIRDTTLATMKAIGDLGTAVTALNPYAALAWGTVQFLITTAINATSVGKLFWENIRDMAILVSKYQTCELVYLSSAGIVDTRQDLEAILERLYTALLTFQVHLVLYARSGFKWLKSFTLHAQREPQKLLDDIVQCEKDLNQQLAVSNGEIAAATYDQVVRIPTSLKTYLDQLQEEVRIVSTGLECISKVVTSELRLKVLQWVSPILTGDSHTRAGSMISSGTTDWILANKLYREWVTADSNTALWLHGSMGTGKSCVTYTAIEDRKKICSASGSKFALAYFYFDGATKSVGGRYEMTTPNIFACLLKQIIAKANSEKLPEPLLELYENEAHERSGPSENDCLKLLSELCKCLSTVTFMFDGLDECPPVMQRNFLEKLRSIFDTSEATVKLFIASRKEGDIPDMLKHWFTDIDITRWTKEAIDEMIQTEVLSSSKSTALRSRYYNREGKDQSQEVIKALQKYADKMFRWVRMALDYLHDSESFGEMAARLGELKGLPGLFQLYDAIYRKMTSGEFEAGRRKAKAIETTLNFLLHGIPSKRLVYDFMTVIVEGCDFNEIRTEQEYTTAVIAKLCPSFIVLDADGDGSGGKSNRKAEVDPIVLVADGNGLGGKGNRTVEADLTGSRTPKRQPALRFAHFSVKEYLLARHSETYSQRAGNARLASICMGVFNDYDTSFQDQVPSFLVYCTARWAEHIRMEVEARDHAEQTQRQISESTLSRYQQVYAKFLPLVGPCDGFLAWHKYFGGDTRRFGNNMTCLAYARSPTTIFTRILLKQDLSLATISTDDLRETFIKLRHRKSAYLTKSFYPIFFAIHLGRFEAVEWILKNSGPEAMMKMRATQAFKDFVSFSFNYRITSYLFNGFEEWFEFESLVRLIEHLLDNGAILSLGDTVRAFRFQHRFHCDAIWRVACKRGIMFSVDENGFTLVDHLLDKNSTYDQRLAPKIIDHFIEQGYADIHRLSIWLLRAARDLTPNLVTFLVEKGADPLAKDLEGNDSIKIARCRLDSVREILTKPSSVNTYAQDIYEERFNSTSIVQYLEPDHLQPDVPTVHMVVCDGCKMASWSLHQFLSKLTAIVPHNWCASQMRAL
jgi:hypothetical protein